MGKEELILYCVNNSQYINSRIDAVDFISEVMGLSKTELILMDNISDELSEKVKKVLIEFNTGKPVAKILNSVCFYGYNFYVNENVLTPRQDSEWIVFIADKIIGLGQKLEKDRTCKNLKVLDMCCGSGCLGLSIKKINEKIDLTMADISEKALDVAKINSINLNVSAEFVQTDMFEQIEGKFNIIVSNPPYIKTGDIESLEIQVKNYDPLIALDGKEDGLYFYKVIANNVDKYLEKNGVLICEFGYDQASEIKELFDKKFKDVKIYKDSGGNDRVVICKQLKGE